MKLLSKHTVKKVKTKKVGIVSKEELQQDIGELLDYLHTTDEELWDKAWIMTRMINNMNRFNENLKYYHTPVDTIKYIDLIYSRTDMEDLIGTLTKRYTAIGKLVLKDEYRG